MSRIYSALLNRGASERIATALDSAYDPGADTPARFLERISERAWEAASEFGGGSADMALWRSRGDVTDVDDVPDDGAARGIAS